MERKAFALAVLLLLLTLLWGCHRTTTVILPPETAPTTDSGENSNTAATEPPSEPSTAPSPDPTEITTTEPTSVPTAVPTITPTTEPTAPPTTAPTSEPTSDPTTEPTTGPTAEPTTEPATEPTTEPTTDQEPTRHPVYDIDRHSIGSLEYDLLDAINRQRNASEEPLPPLTMDHTLCALAAIRAYECTENFSHTRPDDRGAFTVLSDYGYYIWSDLNERIHYGSSGLSAGTIVKGWMYNTDFSASILSGDFTHLGIGVYENGGTTYIVCFFAG